MSKHEQHPPRIFHEINESWSVDVYRAKVEFALDWGVRDLGLDLKGLREAEINDLHLNVIAFVDETFTFPMFAAVREEGLAHLADLCALACTRVWLLFGEPLMGAQAEMISDHYGGRVT